MVVVGGVALGGGHGQVFVGGVKGPFFSETTPKSTIFIYDFKAVKSQTKLSMLKITIIVSEHINEWKTKEKVLPFV